MNAGADSNLKDGFGRPVLHLAAERAHRGVCEELVRHGADPNYARGARRHTLLHTAAISGNYGMAAILLDLGADPNCQTSYGATPLHFAAKTGQQYLANRLLEKGGDLNIIDKHGQTPQQLALQNGFAFMFRSKQGRGHVSPSPQQHRCASSSPQAFKR